MLRQAVNDTATALNENAAPSYDTIDNTLIDPAGQDLLDKKVYVETHDVGTQTNGMTCQTTTEPDPDLGLGSQEGILGAFVALPEDNHSFPVDSLALTHYRGSQHSDPDLEQLTVDQGQQDVLPRDHTNVPEEINQENIRLKLQRDDLLAQRIALENDLSTSFMDKFDLESRLSSANRTIDKGKAAYKSLEDEWKQDHTKLQTITRLFEAKSENEKHVEMLGQQKLLEDENAWLFDQLQMKTEDNRFFACQREAVVQSTSHELTCAMTSQIEMLRQRLSTVQAQLTDSVKAKNRLADELQQERLKHQATRNAFELETKMGPSPYNVQQTTYAGGSAPHKPSKFSSTFPTVSQASLPQAGATPQFSAEEKSIFGADPFLEPCSASSNITQQYGARSKSKFSFGVNTVSESAFTAPKTTTGPTPRTDFNFTFGGPTNHHNSLSAPGITTESDLPKDSTRPFNKAVGSAIFGDPEQTTTTNGSYIASKLPAKATGSVDQLDGLGPRMTTDNKIPYNFGKSADVHVNKKTRKTRRKPAASDFFDEDPVETEVETNTMDVVAAETISEESAPTAFAGVDVPQQPHTTGDAHHKTTAEGTVQTSKKPKTMESEQGTPPLPPTAKQPLKNKAKTSKRAHSRKVAKERKRAAIGEADWSETS